MKIITFDRDGLRLVGSLYFPENFSSNKKYNCVVVQGSLTSVKEQMSAIYCKEFVNRGFVAFTFDYTRYGESDGEPRQCECNSEKVKDIKAAVQYLKSQSFVNKVGLVGICTSAAAATYLVAESNIVDALAVVAGNLSSPELVLTFRGQQSLDERKALCDEAIQKYEISGENTIVTCYSETDSSAANYNPYPGVYDYYLNPKRGNIPEWKNELSVMSYTDLDTINPLSLVGKISVPAIVVHSDGCFAPEQAKKYYESLAGYKKLAWGDGIHFDYYDQPKQVTFAADSITDFFNRHFA